ncbi:MAG TPA: Gfo/Idh/MocA family oxidoreductase [Rugosimonospora sp.]|nr:Gfo/Idh/MocA family oxidoreductase [Rugosimonospora sp.]
MSPELRVGLVGLGYWGPNYARLLDGHIDGARLVACADLRADRLKLLSRPHPRVTMFQDYRVMLKDAGLDAVVVATSAAAHRQIVEDCVVAGLPVLVEKPIAANSTDAEAMQQAAEASGVLLMVGHTFLFNPAVRYVKNLIDSGSLGKIQYLSFRRTGLGPIRSDVNVLWDLAPHDLSMLRYWVGADPLDVTARGQAYLHPDLEDVVFLTLRYPEGVLAGIHVSWLDPIKDRTVTVVGDQRMVVFDDVHPTEKVRVYDKGASYQPGGAEYSEFIAAVRDGEIVIPRIPAGEPLREQLLHFVDCVRTGGKPISHAADGAAIVRILETAQADLMATTRRIPRQMVEVQ